MEKYFLGIDQGGTKTCAVVCDVKGNILATGYDDGLETVYFNDVDELFVKRIKNASLSACKASGISLNDITAVCGGLNGADWDFEYPILKERLVKALGIENAVVLNDCITAKRAGSSSKNCAVICAGTGLNIAVCREDGEEIIYGYYVDNDHQGAMALGSAALRKAIESPLGLCSGTVLTDMVLSFTGYDSTEQLKIDLSMEKFHLETKILAPLLLEAYSSGDFEAGVTIEDFSAAMANYVFAAIDRLKMNGKEFDVVFSGGVFKEAGIQVVDRIFDILSLKEPGLRKVYARYEPVCGAVLTLLDEEYSREFGGKYDGEHNGMLGGELPAAVLGNFDKSAIKHNLIRINKHLFPACGTCNKREYYDKL